MMTKARVTRLWLSAILCAGMALGVGGQELWAQSSGPTGQTSQLTAKTSLDKARAFSDAGEYVAAMAIYHQVFGTHPPAGEWALAYYETEASTDGGRVPAVAGLRALIEKYPADSRYQISLGRVLTFNPATREQGRSYLAKFPGDAQAVQALRQSLLWDAGNPAAASQIRAYLAVHPDPQLAAVMQLNQPTAAALSASVGSSSPGASLPAASAMVFSGPASSTTAVSSSTRPAESAPAVDGPSARSRAAVYQTLKSSRSDEEIKKLDAAQELQQKAVRDATNAGQKPSLSMEMQLASVYAERGEPQLAYPVYQQVLREDPDRADAWAGLLAALHVTGHDKEAITQLDLIPAAARTQLETNQSYLQTMAAVYGAVGQTREASQPLGRVEQDSAAQHGVEQNYVAQHSAAPADVEIQKAWVLYNGGDDVGLYPQLMNLGGRTDLTEDQRRTIQTIWTRWAARRADQASAVGNSRRVVTILNAAARAFPDNLAAIKLLGAAYVQAGQPHQAVLIYKAENMASASTSDYQAAVSAALADGDNNAAEIWLRYALAAFPADAQVLILAARFEQARGDTARAIKYYQSSLKAMPPDNPGSELASALGLPEPTAPLSLPSTAQPQDLSVLLAPGYIDVLPTNQPYLPNTIHTAPLPAYDGTTQLVPPFISNPEGTKGRTGETQARVSTEVESNVREAGARAVGSAESSPSQRVASAATMRAGEVSQLAASNQHAASLGAARAEVYGAYAPYVAPHTSIAARETGYQTGSTSAVTIQIGNDTPRPVQARAEVTDVLPAARYGPSARANRATAEHEQIDAARSERIRQLQEDGVSTRSGRSHPPPEGTMAEVMRNAEYAQSQVPQPTSPPTGFRDVPDTGAQQYPQPRTPPGTNGASITRSRPVPRVPASRPGVAAPRVSVTQPVAPSSTPMAATQGTASEVPTAAATSVPSRAISEGFPAVGPEYPLPPPPTDAALQAHSLPSLGGAYKSQGANSLTQRQQAEDELAALEGSYSGWLGGTGIGRYRSGTSGLDRLYDLESPVEASVVIARQMRLTAVAEPVFLNSGTLNAVDFIGVNVPYLGTMAANAANPPTQQFSNGIGGELQLTSKYIGLAVGYTPYEFPVRNLTGRFLLNAVGNHVSLFGDRQPVKDTQLSYAGLHDPGYGAGSALSLAQSPIWGGVIASTGGLRLQFGTTAASFFVTGEGGILTGQHVLDNYRFKGVVGASFRVKSWANAGELRVGGTLSGMHYQHDEEGLSYGQGGYFSPDTYFLFAVPVRFNGHSGSNLHYTIAGSVGAQTFQQNAAAFYPLDRGLQSSLVASKGVACTAALAETYNCGEYPLIDSTQINYTFRSQAAYRLSDHWYGGGFISANNSSNFDTVSAGFFLRYVFRAQHSQEGYPAGLFQVDGLRSLQIP